MWQVVDLLKFGTFNGKHYLNIIGVSGGRQSHTIHSKQQDVLEYKMRY